MSPRVQKAVAQVKAWFKEHGSWPALPSPLIEQLDLTGQDIEEAVESGLLRVEYSPGDGSPRLVAP